MKESDKAKEPIYTYTKLGDKCTTCGKQDYLCRCKTSNHHPLIKANEKR